MKKHQKHQNETKLNDVYSRNNLPKIKNGIHVIDFGEYEWKGTNLIAFCVNGNNVTYFDGFVVEYIPKEI